MVKDDNTLAEMLIHIQQLSDMLRERGNDGPSKYFADAADTLKHRNREEPVWVECLKSIHRSGPITQYGDFETSEYKLLTRIIKEAAAILGESRYE